MREVIALSWGRFLRKPSFLIFVQPYTAGRQFIGFGGKARRDEPGRPSRLAARGNLWRAVGEQCVGAGAAWKRTKRSACAVDLRKVISDHCVRLPPSWRVLVISISAASDSRLGLCSQC
jgi:hypothetical protein